MKTFLIMSVYKLLMFLIGVICLMSRRITASFTGHRLERFPNYTLSEYEEFIASLRVSINDAIEDGYVNFIAGMGRGFDIIAGEEVCFIRNNTNMNITLELAIPFKGHLDRLKLKDSDKIRYEKLVNEANKITFCKDCYSKGVYHQRNQYMVDNSSLQIAYWDGGPGGTAHAVNYARQEKIKIVNLYGQLEADIPFEAKDSFLTLLTV